MSTHTNAQLLRDVIEAARAWAPTRLTRTGSGERQRLLAAVAAAEGVEINDLLDDEYQRGHEVGMSDERQVHFG